MTKLRFIILGIAAFTALAQTPAPDPQSLETEVVRQKHLINDFGGLTRYGSDDTELPSLKPGEKRVVFFGDQMIELWGKEDPGFFDGKSRLNRGIAGQTTSQMLIRFRQDVVSIHANVVLILAGTNDIAGVHGPSTEEMILDNLASMLDIAKQHGIHVVLASIPPVCDCSGKTPFRQRWQERIEEANDLIRDYATRNHAVYADIYSALADGRNLKADLTSDGVLLNRAGYVLITPIARRAVEEAFQKQ